MTMQSATRQPFLPGVVKDRAKSVSVPPATSCHANVPQDGISINADWKIGADSMNIILYRRDRESKTGNERWRAEGFYSTIGNALIGMVRQGIRDSQLTDLKAVNDRIAQLEQDILRMAAGK